MQIYTFIIHIFYYEKTIYKIKIIILSTVATKVKSSNKAQKINFGKKSNGLAKKHVNKHEKTKTTHKEYKGQGR